MARLDFCDYHNMIAILEKYDHNTDFHLIVDFVEASHLRQYTRRAQIAQSLALLPVADELVSPIGDDSQGEACPADSGLEAEQVRANITKTSTLPSDSTPRVTSLAADEGSMQQQLNELTDLPGLSCWRTENEEVLHNLETMPQSRESLDKGEEAAIERSTEKGSNDTEEMVNVLTSLDAATVLSSGVSVSISHVTKIFVAEVPTGSGSIPTASPPGTGVPTGGVPTGSDVVPSASPIFTTATVATPYIRRKGKEKMVESETPKQKKIQEQMDVQMARQLEEEIERDAQRMDEQITRDAKITRIHAEEELQIMIDGLDMNNETIAKYLQEYYQFAEDLPIGERIELISNLVIYQDNYAKVLKYQIQQRKPLSRKQQKEFYVSVLKSHAEKSERFKRKGLRLEQDSAKKVKISEEVSEEDLKALMQLVPVEEALVKETLNIRPATSDKEKELWVELKILYEPDVEDLLWTHTLNMMHAPVEWKLYDTCGVYHVISKDQEMFMLVEKDYLLTKGLAIVMISYKLQVENYCQMANYLILKIHKIANSPRQQND
nr:hypothetical protein [Tanacetum cinerariifolium]